MLRNKVIYNADQKVRKPNLISKWWPCRDLHPNLRGFYSTKHY